MLPRIEKEIMLWKISCLLENWRKINLFENSMAIRYVIYVKHHLEITLTTNKQTCKHNFYFTFLHKYLANKIYKYNRHSENKIEFKYYPVSTS